MPRRHEPLRGEREDHRRHEPLRQPRDRLTRARLQRTAAGPHERPARPFEQRERAIELIPLGRVWTPPFRRGLTPLSPEGLRALDNRLRVQQVRGDLHVNTGREGGASAVSIARVTRPISSADRTPVASLTTGHEHRGLVGGLMEDAAPLAPGRRAVDGCSVRRFLTRTAGAMPMPRRPPPQCVRRARPGAPPLRRRGRSPGCIRRRRRRRSARGERPRGGSAQCSARATARGCARRAGERHLDARVLERRHRRPRPCQDAARWSCLTGNRLCAGALRSRACGSPTLARARYASPPVDALPRSSVPRRRRDWRPRGPAVRGRRGRLLPVRDQPEQAQLRDRTPLAEGPARARARAPRGRAARDRELQGGRGGPARRGGYGAGARAEPACRLLLDHLVRLRAHPAGPSRLPLRRAGRDWLMSTHGPEEVQRDKVGCRARGRAHWPPRAAAPGALHGGGGARIEVPLLDSGLAGLVNVAQNALVTECQSERHGNAHPNIVPYQDFETASGRIAVAAANDGLFRALCSVLGAEALGSEERFATTRPAFVANRSSEPRSSGPSTEQSARNRPSLAAATASLPDAVSKPGKARCSGARCRAAPARHRHQRVLRHVHQPREAAVEQRHLDRAPPLRRAALASTAGGGVQAREHVHQRHADLVRRPVARAR